MRSELTCGKYENVQVEVVATDASLTFYDSEDIVKAGSRVWRDEDEWKVCIICCHALSIHGLLHRLAMSLVTPFYTLNCADGQISFSLHLVLLIRSQKWPVVFAIISPCVLLELCLRYSYSLRSRHLSCALLHRQFQHTSFRQ